MLNQKVVTVRTSFRFLKLDKQMNYNYALVFEPLEYNDLKSSLPGQIVSKRDAKVETKKLLQLLL